VDYTQGLDNPDALKSIIIGIPKQLKECSCDPEIIKAYEDAVKKLEAAGAKTIEVDIPSYQYVLAVYNVIMCAEVSANIATFDGIRYGYSSKNAKGLNDGYAKSRGESMGYEVKKRAMFGTYVLGAKNYHKYYHQAQKVRTLFINEINEAYKKCGVIFSPSTLQMPVKFGEALPEENDMFLAAANLAGLPGITVPCSFTKAGMPAGVHFMGPRLSDAKLLQIAAAYEKISGFDINKFPLENSWK
jgi:aspartyl-tRNA(Asn)/glutamyl-tRNA(Gln) amidotransferase subunit A